MSQRLRITFSFSLLLVTVIHGSFVLGCDESGDGRKRVWYDLKGESQECVSVDGKNYCVSISHRWSSCRETQSALIEQVFPDGKTVHIASFSDSVYRNSSWDQSNADSLKISTSGGHYRYEFRPSIHNKSKTAVRMTLKASPELTSNVLLPQPYEENNPEKPFDSNAFSGSLSFKERGKNISTKIVCKYVPVDQLYGEKIAKTVDGQVIGTVNSKEFHTWLFSNVKK